MSALPISHLETGLVRVFALFLPDDEAKAVKQSIETELARLLGVTALDTHQAELFPIADLDEMSLTEFLEDGHGVAPDALKGDKAKLNALEGWVLLLRSAAFEGLDVTLHPSAQITLIGTYAEPTTDWSEDMPLTAASATEQNPPKKQPSEAAMAGRIATIALLFLFLFTALIVWIAA